MHVTLLDVSLWVLASWLKEVLNCFSALLKPYIGNAGSNKSNVNTSSSHPVKYSEFQLLRYIRNYGNGRKITSRARVLRGEPIIVTALLRLLGGGRWIASDIT